MEYTQEKCRKDTINHINEVRRCLSRVIVELEERGRVHDKSKLESPEIEIFTEYTPKLASSTYGSTEYHENLKGMQKALKHHYENNSHHPEHYKNGIQGMNLLDIIEMFCDWKAATLRHVDGDIRKSIEINQKRFNYSDELKEIFKNSVAIFD
ncbi:DUF5662 family protein [Oceanobacillus indicireducens]|uniref:Uncharacterized protein n=1 Tax=Oceanobacillus indicireducens TaxID=1004261 RepID=A0A917Y2L6_9BACI|nr:DUF5662 family protein [Oceanobacillus indicireducens]GGN64316.1 hypothetical protein GCM10007971_32060 [Oceanobacillus indicireducens]